MGWLDSPQSVHKGKLDAFFENRYVDLDLIVRLSNDYKNAKIALDKATNFDIHNSKRNIKHQRCAEDYNYKMDLLYYAIDRIYQQYNESLKPCPNE